MVISKYLAKEVYASLSVVTAVLLLIFLSQQFIRYLTRAAAGKISGAVVLKIMSMQIPYLLGLLLPIGLFLGILLAYGRLYVDNEMTVLSACGFSKSQLVKITILHSVLIMLIVGFITLFITPYLRVYQAKLMMSSPAETLLQTLTPGRFHVSPNGQTIYYIEDINRQQNQAKNIFVADEKSEDNSSSNSTWQITSAKTGYQLSDKKTGDEFIVAVDGFRYIGTPGEKNFSLVKFHEYGMRLDDEVPEIRLQHEAMSNSTLWEARHEDLNAVAELQWRLAAPLSVPLLALLAVPLSYVKPRQGRYAKLLPAILLYVIYANMMYVARGWVEEGAVNSLIGIWWLPASILILALILLRPQSLFFERKALK